MRRRRAWVAVCAATALAAGCAAPAPERQELTDALVQSGLSEEVAGCVADALVDNLTDDELADLALRGSGAAPVDDPDRADDRADAVRLAMDACRVLQAEQAPSTTTTTAAAGAPSTVPDGPGAQLRPVPSEAEPEG